MYHSPGLWDGDLNSGNVCAALPSRCPWSRINSYSISSTGNKFGRSQVPILDWVCACDTVRTGSGKTRRARFDFRGVDFFWSGLKRLLFPAV